MSYVGKVNTGQNDHLVAASVFGTCSTAADVAAKIVVLDNFDALMNGVTIQVKFVYSNTASNPTMNVNNTGAKPIYLNGTNPPGVTALLSWSANSVLSFTYDGTAWIMNDVNKAVVDAVDRLNAGYNPVSKTSGMTKAVGNDSEGKLWTEPVESSEVQTAANTWLSANITNPDSPPLDRSLSSNASAAPADIVGDLKNTLTAIERSAYKYVETAIRQSSSNNYYKEFSAFDVNNIYCIEITVATEGQYTLKTGTNAAGSYMVDVLCTNETFYANTPKRFYSYKPTGAYQFATLGANIEWEMKIYSLVDIAEMRNDVDIIIPKADNLEGMLETQYQWVPLSGWKKGYIDGNQPNKAITCDYFLGIGESSIRLTEGYQIRLVQYNQNKVYESYSIVKGYTEINLNTEKYYRITLVHGKAGDIGSAFNITIDEHKNVQVFKNIVSEKIASRSKVYGIEIDNSQANNSVIRKYDASILHNDYQIGNDYALHDGDNNFDYVYPWCDMHLCNVKIENGIKVVTYEGESAFKTDGSNGEVMVEIPKFYSMRKKDGNKETICITGEPKAGFSCEPAFYDSETGKELDTIYVGAYPSKIINDKHTSRADVIPTTGQSLLQFRSCGEMYDFATLQCLQKLISIEMGAINLSPIFGGFSFLPYDNNIVAYESTTGNTAVFCCPEWSEASLYENGFKTDYLFVGERITVSNNSGVSEERYITALGDITEYTDDGTTYHRRSVTFDGPSVAITAGATMLYGNVQKNGFTKTMSYHTGRKNLTPYTVADQFRYRGIEGLWGNLGEMIDGIRLKDLDYYIAFERSDYADLANYTKLSYKSVEHRGYNWKSGIIKKMGFDRRYPNVNLPDKISDDDWSYTSNYYGDLLCAYYRTDNSGNPIAEGTEFTCVNSMAWDGAWSNGPYMYRFWTTENEGSWLYGTRMIYRTL